MSLAPPTGAEQEGEFRPSDEASRRTIEHELGETLFVEASAGTGKTHSLVARTVNLVAEGMTTAGPHRSHHFHRGRRLRTAAPHPREAGGGSGDNAGRGPSGTLPAGDHRPGPGHHPHPSFLRRHAAPRTGRWKRACHPVSDTTDEIAASLRFDEAWDEWLDTALETDSPLAPHLSLTLTLGLSLEQLKQVAQAFHENYADLRDAALELGPRPQGDGVRTILERWPEAERLCNFSRLGEADLLFNHVRGEAGNAAPVVRGRTRVGPLLPSHAACSAAEAEPGQEGRLGKPTLKPASTPARP